MCGSGKPKTKFGGTVEAGTDEYVLANDDMYAELICDSMGAHVRHENIVITYKCKGSQGGQYWSRITVQTVIRWAAM